MFTKLTVQAKSTGSGNLQLYMSVFGSFELWIPFKGIYIIFNSFQLQDFLFIRFSNLTLQMNYALKYL